MILNWFTSFSFSLNISKHTKIQVLILPVLTEFNLKMFWEHSVLSYHKVKHDNHTHAQAKIADTKIEKPRESSKICFLFSVMISKVIQFCKNLCCCSKSVLLAMLCVTGKPQWLKLLHRNWKESWIQWSKVYLCVYITPKTYSTKADKQHQAVRFSRETSSNSGFLAVCE